MVCIDCNETEEEEEDDEEGLDIRRDTQARALRSDSRYAPLCTVNLSL